MGVFLTQEISDPIEVPVPVSHTPLAGLGTCAGGVLAGAEIRLTRQGQLEPGLGMEQVLADPALVDVLLNSALDGRTERIDFVRFHEPPGYGQRRRSPT